MIENKKIIEKPEGYVVVINSDSDFTPLACPVCSLLMRGLTDSLSYKQHSCCSDCSLTWAIPYSQKWKNGWRPSVQILQEEIKKRLELPSYRA